MLRALPIPADIYDKVSGEIQKKGYDCECLGGGRISHQSQDKKIHVYGYSMVRPQPRPCWPSEPGRLPRASRLSCRTQPRAHSFPISRMAWGGKEAPAGASTSVG